MFLSVGISILWPRSERLGATVEKTYKIIYRTNWTGGLKKNKTQLLRLLWDVPSTKLGGVTPRCFCSFVFIWELVSSVLPTVPAIGLKYWKKTHDPAQNIAAQCTTSCSNSSSEHNRTFTKYSSLTIGIPFGGWPSLIKKCASPSGD